MSAAAAWTLTFSATSKLDSHSLIYEFSQIKRTLLFRHGTLLLLLLLLLLLQLLLFYP
jgi:uncharacterized membrane protein YesL